MAPESMLVAWSALRRSVDRKNRALALSIKAKDYDDEQEAVKSLKDQEETTSPGTIGDLIKAQMGEK